MNLVPTFRRFETNWHKHIYTIMYILMRFTEEGNSANSRHSVVIVHIHSSTTGIPKTDFYLTWLQWNKPTEKMTFCPLHTTAACDFPQRTPQHMAAEAMAMMNSMIPARSNSEAQASCDLNWIETKSFVNPWNNKPQRTRALVLICWNTNHTYVWEQ